MAILLVVSHTQSVYGTSSSIDTTGADFIVVSLSYYHTGYTTDISLTDNKGNTWTLVTKYAGTIAANRLYYAKNPTVGSGHTFTTPAVPAYFVISILAFSGVDTTSPFDVENGATSIGATSLSTGSVTPTNDNSVVVTGFTCDNNSGVAVTIDSGFTKYSTNYSGGNNMGGGIAYLIQTTASAVNPTWNVTNFTAISAAIAVFKQQVTSATATATFGTITLTAPVASALASSTATATFGTITLTAPIASGVAGVNVTVSATFGTITLTAPVATAFSLDIAGASFGTITLTTPTATAYAVDNTATATFSSIIYLQAPTCSPYGPPFTVYMQQQQYWGRFSRGQFLNVMWNPEYKPDGVAEIDFWHEATTIVKTITLPATDDVYTVFGQRMLLDNNFIDGNYVAVIRFSSGAVAQCSLGYLSVMGGTGSPPVIGVLEIDRTLGRSVITQDGDGRFMIGYQPQLAAYAVE